MIDLLTSSALAIAILMLATWVVSVVVNDASIVDIVWGFGFVVATGIAFLAGPLDQLAGRPLLMLVLVSVWGLRLSGYLALRKLGTGEDRRYQARRKKNPDSFWITSLFTVFGIQAVILWVVSVPPVVTQSSESALYWLDWVGVAVFAVGLAFETVGDVQLARFKARPDSKGKVMDRGLWRYTRHPNYFGDFCVWWGLYLVAAAGGAWWAVFSPLLMSVLLMRYSGVGPLERTIGKRRRGYADYARRTNAFFPGPSKTSG